MRSFRSLRAVKAASLALPVSASLFVANAKFHGNWWPAVFATAGVLLALYLVWAATQRREDERPAPAELGASAALHAASGSADPIVVTDSLRAAPSAFTGRESELAEIDAAVARLVADGRGVAVVSLWGMPGIGKTALAVHAAHRHREHFTDRRLHVPLHAHGDEQNRLDTGRALAFLLTGDGVRPRALPEGAEQRAALWRSRMAGKRVLLVLDDAESAEQVAQLIPGDGMCLVLVTSRSRLVGLRSQHHAVVRQLGPLTAPEAAALLAGRAGRSFNAESDEAVAKLVRQCGYLPMAVSILACRLHAEPELTAARLRAELDAALPDVRGWLSVIDRQVDDETLTVFATFDASYRRLTPVGQQVLELMGVHPGTALDAAAVAAALPELAEPARCLESLCAQALCDRIEPPAGMSEAAPRYHPHDLIRDYARLRATESPERASRATLAVDRLLRHYRQLALEWAGPIEHSLTRHSKPGGEPVRAPASQDTDRRAAAVRWFELERANLLGLLAYTEQAGLDDHLIGLATALAGFLRNSGPLDVAAARLRAAADVAGRHAADGDPLAHAVLLNHLGIICRLSGDTRAANEALRVAGRICWRLWEDGDGLAGPLGAANALNERGIVANLMGRHRWAVAALGRALGLYWWVGDDIGVANAAKNLAIAHFQLGERAVAADLLAAALAGYQALGDLLGEAEVRNHQGMLGLDSGDVTGALGRFHAALTLATRARSGLEQARAWEGAGRAHLALGKRATAWRLLERAHAEYLAIAAARDADRINATLALQWAAPSPGRRAGWPRRRPARARAADLSR